MNLCYLLGKRLYQRRLKKAAERVSTRGDSPADYWRWQFETSATYFPKFPGLNELLQGSRVLDVGCGLGGRTCYLANREVAKVVGTDINHKEIEKARQLSQQQLDPESSQRVRFVQVSEDDAPGRLGLFDIVLIVDALEHVRDPVAILNHAYDHTRPGGTCYFSTVGWYHHSASHVGSILPIPFLTLWFSDAAILDAIRRIVSAPYYQPTMWDSNPPAKRWEGIHDLSERPGEYLNKISIRGIKRAITQSKFERAHLDIRGFSWRQCPMLRAANFLARIPVIQEVYHSGVFCRLTRD